MADQFQAESSGSKLKLKLKISQKNNLENQSKTLQIEPPTKNHVCKACDRSFSSGKALGGHMSSAHVQAQANKDLALKKLKKSNLGFRCKICARDFHSRKSLFGHMKSHPDRHWRGMDPPQMDEKSEDSLDYEDLSSFSDGEGEGEFEQEENLADSLGPVIDLGASLKGWGVKGRRGRLEPDSEPDEDQDELHAAVHQLIRMVNSPFPERAEDVAENRGSGSGLGPGKMVVGENDEPAEKSMSIELDDGVGMGRKAKRAKADKRVTGSDEKLRSPTIQEKVSDSSVSPTPTSTPGKDKVYACNSCDKIFSTFQALGGHSSTHSKPRVGSNSNAIEEVDTYRFGSSSKAQNAKARGRPKLFGTGKGVTKKGINLIDMVPSSDQASAGNGSTQVNVVGGVPYNSQATFGYGSTHGSWGDMAPYGSQATLENGSTSTFDRVSSSEQATSTDVTRTDQEGKPKVFLDLNLFPDEDEI